MQKYFNGTVSLKKILKQYSVGMKKYSNGTVSQLKVIK